MKAALNSLIDELKRLRKEGVEHLYVAEDSIRELERSLSADARKAAAAAVAAIPERIRSATVEDFNAVLKEEPPPAPAAPAQTAPQFGPPPAVALPEGDKQTRWNALREQVLNCPVCKENVREGCQIVFGVGNLNADIFFCGEAPGADEEEQGEPFVGKAGQLLTRMIKAMGLEREQVYIGNIMNWRPQLPTRVGNRPPTEEEMAFCLPYLTAQVEVVAPKVIVALGATAAKGLLGQDAFRSLREVKGAWREFAGIPVLSTYHPAYLLRNDTKRDKRSAWEDLLQVMEGVGLPITEKQRGYFL